MPLSDTSYTTREEPELTAGPSPFTEAPRSRAPRTLRVALALLPAAVLGLLGLVLMLAQAALGLVAITLGGLAAMLTRGAYMLLGSPPPPGVWPAAKPRKPRAY